MEHYKYWIGKSNVTIYGYFENADKLREYVKSVYGKVGYGFQLV